jgi:hypothetical protein
MKTSSKDMASRWLENAEGVKLLLIVNWDFPTPEG